MKLRRWGGHIGRLNFAWWNMWTNRPIFEVAWVTKFDVPVWRIVIG